MLSEAQILRPDAAKRQSFALRFSEKRNLTEKLVAPLSEEDCMLSATNDTSPPKWHLAHTTWFFEHFILREFDQAYSVFDESFEYLFNSYYRTLGDFLPKADRKLLSRPALKEVFLYRRYVDQKIMHLLESAHVSVYEKISKLVELGINHEQQHQELLLMDIKQNFFAHPSHPAYLPDSAAAKLAQIYKKIPEGNSFAKFHGGLIDIGNDSETFHYDNEGGCHRVWIEPFELSTHLVTNQEYLEFIEAGNYEDPRHWLSDGWDWLQKEAIQFPLYWLKNELGYSIMTLHGLAPLYLSEPVSHISYYEAQAFAKWKGARLPTEFEWEYAASFSDIEGNFLEDEYFHPVSMPGMHGNLWEWTGSAHLPYPGYRELDDALFEYNSKFMCNQFVLRGGSAITPHDHYRPTYRNFFYPHMRWQFCGFRLAKDQS